MDAEIIAFDVFGTLVDWRSSITAELARVGGRAGVDADWPAVADAWRSRYRPTLDRVVGGVGSGHDRTVPSPGHRYRRR